jgi:N-acetylglucosaminyl-diphospho-decaprenol L-rhamnosyltransferase
MIQEAFPHARAFGSPRNLGFGAANNLAIREGSAPYVLALNPDTRMTEGALDTLVQLMEDDPRIGICGCRLVRDDGSFDHAARRSFPTVLGALSHFTKVGQSARAPERLSQYRATDVEAGPVDAVNGAFMLMRRSALDEVGLFDEGYWMYMEDLDLCYRFREAGYVTWYEPSVTVWHVKHGTSGSIRSVRLNYAFHYGMFRFYRKHYARRHIPITNAIVYAGIGAKFALAAIHSTWRRLIARGRYRRDHSSSCVS